jgi:hypothetical protein
LKAERNGKKKTKQVAAINSGLMKGLKSMMGKRVIPKPP